MSHKRDLYKPVVSDGSGNAGRRRPLAQGRLVTKSEYATTTTADVTGQNDSSGCPLASRSMGSPRQGGLLHSSPRRDLSALMADMQLAKQSRIEGDSSPTTPRKHLPQASMEQSPIPLKPSESLDLTDTEPDSDNEGNPRPVFYPGARKNVCDLHGRGAYEEDVTEPVVHVNRHATDPVHCDLRNTGNVASARKIPVDQVNSINIITTKNLEQYSCGESTDDTSTPADTRKQSTAKQLFQTEETDESTSKDQHSMTDVDQKPASVEEKARAGTSSKTADVSTASVPQEGTKKRVTRKPPKVVKSRYMSSITDPSASSKKGPMKATDRSVLGKANKNVSSTYLQSSSKTGLKRKTAAKTSSSARAKPDAKTTFNLTPEVRGKSHSKASTPSQDLTLQPLGGVDVSAIAHIHDRQHSSIFSTPSLEGSAIETSALLSPRNRKNSLRAETSSKRSESMDTKHSHLLEASKLDAPSKKTVEAVQNQLTATYCRYLQWAYLDAKSKKASQAQEKVVMEQLYGLWSECEKLEKEKTTKTHELEKLKHLSALDDVLDMQERVLAPICENLSEVEKQYKTFAGGIDTTRHQLPIRGVYLPDDEAIEAVEHELEETEQLLAELYRVTRPHAQSVNNFSSSLAALKRTTQTEVELLAKVQELVSASQTLVTHESSLLIQDMHSDGIAANSSGV